MRRTTTVLGILATSVALLFVLGSQASAQQTTCSTFTTQEEAQAYYDAHRAETQLDTDGDGKACEGLPTSGAPAATVAPATTPSTIPNNGVESGVMAMSGLSLIEAGYGLTLVARRYGVKRRAIPMYLLRKLASAGKAGQYAVPIAEDVYLVHQSALVATIDDRTREFVLTDDVLELEPAFDDAEFRPDWGYAFVDVALDDDDDPWSESSSWRQ